MQLFRGLMLIFAAFLFTFISNGQIPARQAFQKNVEGRQTDLFVLKNNKGMQVAITNFGARIVSIILNDKNGKPQDVVMGFNSIDDYISSKGSRSYGALMGRYANRIGNGTFKLDGVTYLLAKNNNGNNIHGGPLGFNERVWDVKKASRKKLVLSYLSKDGEMGFPGNLTVSVTYTLDNKNRLGIQYEAKTDKKTVINLTNHSFFNLNGGGDILNHEVYINADRFTPVTDVMLPTGELKAVDQTPFDLRSPVTVVSRVNNDDPQLKIAGGYDHNFVLNNPGKISVLAASAYSPLSGIKMETYTTEPGVQFFTANGLKGLDKGKDGKPLNARAGLCFETQHFPDSPNQRGFPSTELKPGEKFSSRTVYKFKVVK